jgi:DNA helicase-2/ATP-dependent DNA helicase PcrA
LAAVLEFVTKWEQKPITKSGEAAELLEYLDYLKEARGSIPMPSTEADAVRLMTAHSAKGLEFGHTFMLRAHSPCFPVGFKESLVEFPRELRDPDSVAEQDDKALHDQEERRLFYVAMTRARDSLTIYAQRGRGKNDPTPPGFLRELLKDSGLKKHLRQRWPRGLQTDLFAQESNTPAPSRIAAWIEMPPASDLSARLSASAVQSYETCPLQFKLEREWRIPGEVPAAMQYGGTMHRILRDYYESVRLGRTMSEGTLLELFQIDLSQANIQDRYQNDLYLQQGIDQLKEFLAVCQRVPTPDVLHTEEFFEVRIGQTVVAGRIDRMDKLADGRVAITDYKTGKAQTQEDADESLQLSIYALAAREKWGYRADRLMFYNLGENSSVMAVRNDGQLQEAAMKVQEVAAHIAAGKFDPTPGFHCNFCAYRSLCPATEKRLYSISSNTR